VSRPGPQLEYGTTETAHAPRTAGTWAKLVLVWTAGVVMWLIYIAAALYLIFRLLA
jgi:hypothetical protein